MADGATAVYDDLGEQAVWRRLYATAHELPAGYCALRAAALPAAEWPKVHVLHDPHLIHSFHRHGFEEAGMLTRLSALEAETDAEVAKTFTPLLGGEGVGRSRRKAKGGGVSGSSKRRGRRKARNK